ncbi:MAG: VanW family protein [Candidatus Fermentithermobacillus carboniphilus]|uniref:VanW family protein n=1 Tax=Candidatus Fermentithermobacillus carboniphilus TaxID=3085328 RepID=A0AAT9LCA5_9FIRM|nr:MAG: VanW family protein [Candidatus Fermentithermobacillus carboniphilus]
MIRRELMKKAKRRGLVWAGLLALVLASIPGYVVIWPGTRVGGVEVGWMTPSKALEHLEKILSWEDRYVLLQGKDGMQERVLWRELGVTPDVRRTVASLKRPLWLWFRRDYPLLMHVDSKMLRAWLDAAALIFNVEPQDARYVVGADDAVSVVPDRSGWFLDREKVLSELTQGEKWDRIPDTMELPFIDVQPDTRKEELEAYLPLTLIASYSTFYEDNNDRAHNIHLAAKSLDGVMLKPGEVLSFNHVTGPRTGERGYRKASVFVGNEIVDDFGGGVCQVSTTLYVALCKAGFQVVERHNHGMPVAYVPLGLDATVVFDLLDLKMKNDTGFPCVIKAETGQGRITVKVFGKKENGLSIEVESRIIEEIPAEYPSAGQETQGEGSANAGEGQKKLRSGYMVETLRKYVKDGKVIRVEKLNTSWYPPEKPVRPSSVKGTG